MSKPHQLSHQLAVLTFQGKGMNEMLQKTPIQSPFKPKCGKKNAATALPPLSYCLSLLYQRYRFVCLSYSLSPLPSVLSFLCSGSQRVTTVCEDFQEGGVGGESTGRVVDKKNQRAEGRKLLRGQWRRRRGQQ